MPPKELTKIPLNSYHNKKSLLFQFILSDFFEAYRYTPHISARLPSNQKPLGSMSRSQEKKQYTSIKEMIGKLIGTQHEDTRLFTWHAETGVLPKLKSYCTLSTKKGGHEEKEIFSLTRCTQQAWLLCFQVLDLFHTGFTASGQEAQHTLFNLTVDKLITSMQRLARILVSLLPNFTKDENVIYFLLQHKDTLQALFGQQFLLKLLKKMYTNGTDEARQFLLKRYTKRGFHHLVPIINTKIAELDPV